MYQEQCPLAGNNESQAQQLTCIQHSRGALGTHLIRLRLLPSAPEAEHASDSGVHCSAAFQRSPTFRLSSVEMYGTSRLSTLRETTLKKSWRALLPLNFFMPSPAWRSLIWQYSRKALVGAATPVAAHLTGHMQMVKGLKSPCESYDSSKVLIRPSDRHQRAARRVIH